jgi:transcriptional regulator with XRE-family HTH domain
VVVPRFGARLKALREAVKIGNKKRSQEHVANRLAVKYGLQLDRSTLSEYEKGTVMAPDAGVLWGLAQIYDVPVGELAQFLVAERSGGKVSVPEVTAGVHIASPLSATSGATQSSTPAGQEARVGEPDIFDLIRGAWKLCPEHRREYFAVHCVNFAAGIAEREAKGTGTGPKA